MIDTCLINKASGCSRISEIEFVKKGNVVQVAYAFDWGINTDTPALIHDLFYFELKPKAEKLGINLKFQGLGGKQTGSIFCDICCEIQKSDIILFDISSHNINVLFELGLAIGSGAYIYLLRSKHQKRPSKNFSDLNGILEYRFTRSGGRLRFHGNLISDIMSNLSSIARIRSNEY
jgi:hypothetical protein